MSEVLLKVTQINKSFGPTKALTDVDFTLRAGEVHGLIGENGSGKSTLSTIIAGVQKADNGSMILKGQAYTPADALAANDNGICMLLQEQGTFDGITVAANIFVGREKEFVNHGLMDMKRMFKAAGAALENIGVPDIHPNMSINQLSFEERKLVEIARAMEKNPDILIVDETTTALSRKGRDLLYALMDRMKKRGKSVIFISHDIGEVREVCDYLTVLRDGVKIDTLEKADFSDERIRKLMVGREVSENFYRNDAKASCQPEVAIRLKNVSYGLLKNIDMDIHKGEIVGIGGLTDCGMHDLGKIMFGLIKPDRGHCELGDGTVINSSVTAIKKRMGYVAKDRDKEALMMGASIKDNICAPSLKKLSRHGLITNRRERAYVSQWAKALSIKMNNIDQYVRYLSGGNKQKVSVAKWVGFDADILIFDCPTRGIDIGVKAAIYQLLMDMKDQGKAILMISEELMEIIGMSDRTLILKDGVITGIFKRDEMLTEDKLIEYII